MDECRNKHKDLCEAIEKKTKLRLEAVDARLNAIDKEHALQISKKISPTNWIAIAALIISLITLIMHLTKTEI